MKVLQDPDQVLHIMDVELDALRKNRKKFPKLTGKETAEIYGQETAIIAIAGKAAHLAGVVASHTSLPVIGVPVCAKDLGGMDMTGSSESDSWSDSLPSHLQQRG